jgi:Sec7-like guanine-nucleotide exchange factor
MNASTVDLCNESRDSPRLYCPQSNLKDNTFSKDENGVYSPEPQAGASMTIAFDLLVQKGIKKAVEYLTACNILTPSARDIASFLRIHQKHIDPSALGDYLGEENICGGNQCDLIRYHYVRVISFVGMKVDEA